MDNIKKIQIIFENCQSSTLIPEDIKDITFNDLEYSIRKISDKYMGGFIFAKNTKIILAPSANKKVSEDMKISGYTDLFKRICEHRDIVSIQLYFNDKTENIYVKWHDNTNLEENLCQNSKIDKSTGNLVISIF